MRLGVSVVCVAAVGSALSGAFGCSDLLGIDDPSPRATNTDAGVAPDGGSFVLLPLQTSVPDQLDLLFMVDNSPGMEDKQRYLDAAIPDLLGRLVQPYCLTANGVTVDGRSSPDGAGTCPTGDTVEFPPVHDMHIAVVTSSLGSRGGDVCPPSAMNGSLSAHNDDRGELIDRGGDDETPIADMTSSNYLSWFPAVPANVAQPPGLLPSITSLTTLESDFSDLVSGVHHGGCGVESQLESWYRFLVQPDPYLTIDVTLHAASWSDVDATILNQRHDFLRPNSIVAIVDLTDENDSEIDVRSLGQEAYQWLVGSYQPPRGTTVCATNPADPGCTTCAATMGNLNCENGLYTNGNDWGFAMNLRHVHMKEKYGIDLQFPLTRYVNGLTSQHVPDRIGEYPMSPTNQVSPSYVGANDCTNPLYASSLPDGSQIDTATLCDLPTGTRPTNQVFYAHIGGVPSQLLHYNPDDSVASALTDADWGAILGFDPDNFDYGGIDPHMIESYGVREGLALPTAADDADPANGREWITDTNPANGGTFVDLEYACTFPLTSPRDCTLAANAPSCDCPTTANTTWDHDFTPPVCGGVGSLNPSVPQTTQIAGKAYPTIREIELSHLLGAQGILSSICPIHTVDNATSDDPYYGYRPAVEGIVDHVKADLVAPCLPQALPVGADGSVGCVMLESLASPMDTCEVHERFIQADPTAAAAFMAEIAATESSATVGTPEDPASNPICQVPQLGPSSADFVNGSCAFGADAGWCYVTGTAAGACPQAIRFTASGFGAGALVALYCPVGTIAADAGTP